MKTTLEIIRKERFAKSPWKNGGGVTYEAMREPPAGPFLWRVSVAHIEKSGPFSDFAGYRRRMVLLQGRGLNLTFGDGRHHELRAIGDEVEFDGATTTQCELIDGPCVDLNLMTANSLNAAGKLQRFQGSFTVTAATGQTILVFSLAAALGVADGAGSNTRLNPWDLAVVSQASVRLETVEPGTTSVPVAVFIATISQ